MKPTTTIYTLIINLYQSLYRRWHLSRDPVAYARQLGVRIGKECRLLGVDESTFGSEPYLITIGDHVTITSGVRFVTHDGGVWVFRQQYPDIELFAPIVVGNNVFIGFNVILLPGITIGDNCVIGAGSIVTADIPMNTVAVGVPARVIRTVDEYWEKLQPHCTFVRTRSAAEKRRQLISQFSKQLAIDKIPFIIYCILLCKQVEYY